MLKLNFNYDWLVHILFIGNIMRMKKTKESDRKESENLFCWTKSALEDYFAEKPPSLY